MGRYKTVCISAREILKNKKIDSNGNLSFSIDLSKYTFKNIEVYEAYESPFSHFVNDCYFGLKTEEMSYEQILWKAKCFYGEGIAYRFLDVDFQGLLNDIEDFEKDPKGIALDTLIRDGFTVTNIQNNHFFSTMKYPLEYNEITYKAFLTSSSKVKNQRVVFLNEIYLSSLNKVFDMGLDISKIPSMNPSKYNAYRGLYLTDGEFYDGKNVTIDLSLSEKERNESDEEVKLSAEKFLVLKDEELSSMAKFITASKKENSKNEWELDDIKTGNIFFDPFDGEGIVSPDLLYRLVDIFYDYTYQVRLPFAKGVLHNFDIYGFIKEIFGDEKIFIKDFWGIERDLSKVKIICGSSFFKCAEWLCDGYGISEPSKQNDPLDKYFHYFYEYEHSLVVCNTEYGYDNSTGNIKLNYQILNTLDMDKEEFLNFIKSSMPEDKLSLSRDTIENYRFLEKYKIKKESIYSLCKHNDNFVKHDKVKNCYRNIVTNEFKETAQGRIQVTGERRFLSRDLIAFMYCVLKKSNVGDSPKLKELENQLMPTGYFYAPNMNLEAEKMYGIYRSPHLSRNEQVALKAYIPDKDSLYHKYLCKNKTVCFMPLYSLDPLTMGGADMDGDTVSIITNQAFINAILRGVYENVDGTYVRKLPIELIPNTKSENKEAVSNQLSIQALAKSFNSQIGLISNMALQIGMLEYFSEKDNPQYTNQTAFSAILAGLSIDAAKSGVNPSTKSIRNLIKKKSNYKKIIDKKIKPFEVKGIKVNKGEKSYTLENHKQQISIAFANDDCANVELLPSIFCEACINRGNIGLIKKDANASTNNSFYLLQTKNYYQRMINGRVTILVFPKRNEALFIFQNQSFKKEFDKNKIGKNTSEVLDYIKSNAFVTSIQIVLCNENSLKHHKIYVPMKSYDVEIGEYKAFPWKKYSNPKIQDELKLIIKAKNKYNETVKSNQMKKNEYDYNTIRKLIVEKTGVEEWEDYLKEYKQFFSELIKTTDQAISIWNTVLDSNWKYMTKQQRIDFLNSIEVFCAEDDFECGSGNTVLDYDAYQLLIDFTKNGYALLPLLIKSRYIDLKNNEAIYDMLPENIEEEFLNSDYNYTLYSHLLNAYIDYLKNPNKSYYDLKNEILNLEIDDLSRVFSKLPYNEYKDTFVLINLKAAGYTDGEIWDYFEFDRYKFDRYRALILNQDDAPNGILQDGKNNERKEIIKSFIDKSLDVNIVWNIPFEHSLEPIDLNLIDIDSILDSASNSKQCVFYEIINNTVDLRWVFENCQSFCGFSTLKEELFC